MAERGAPLGSQNRRKGRLFASALNDALALPSRVDQLARIAIIADKLVTMAEAGDLQAIREIADRLDGKAVQAVEADVSVRHAFALPLSAADTTEPDEWAHQTGR